MSNITDHLRYMADFCEQLPEDLEGEIQMYREAADRIDALEALVRYGMEAVADLGGCQGNCPNGQCFASKAREALGDSS